MMRNVLVGLGLFLFSPALLATTSVTYEETTYHLDPSAGNQVFLQPGETRVVEPRTCESTKVGWLHKQLTCSAEVRVVASSESVSFAVGVAKSDRQFRYEILLTALAMLFAGVTVFLRVWGNDYWYDLTATGLMGAAAVMGISAAVVVLLSMEPVSPEEFFAIGGVGLIGFFTGAHCASVIIPGLKRWILYLSAFSFELLMAVQLWLIV